MLAVALDANPAAAAESITAANPTYPCLVDVGHVVAELYGMVNVPSAVWIDEQGRVVRPAEPAGATDAFRTELDRATMQMSESGAAESKRVKDAYYDAVRAWVREGGFALSADEARRRARVATAAEALAAAHLRLAVLLAERGDREAAGRHAREASSVAPGLWHVRRQGWSIEGLAPAEALAAFFAAVDELGLRPYHVPIDL